MTEQQKQFLQYAIVEQKKYDEISRLMKVDRKTLSAWWTELEPVREELSALRKLWKLKCKTLDFTAFKSWYDQAEKKCHYCGITAPQIHAPKESGLIHTKRWKTRGRKLEIERLQPNEPYDNTRNLVFCCYWCNNAKSDEFSREEFLKIGQVIKEIWKERRFNSRFTSDGSEIGVIKQK